MDALDRRAAGDVTLDGNGVPTGEIQLKATNWREMLKVAENSDMVPQGVLPFIERGCLLYTSPSPRDGLLSRMPSSA